MSYFKAKMHQIQFLRGSAPDPAGGAYSAPPDPLAGFKERGWVGEGVDITWPDFSLVYATPLDQTAL